MNKKLFVRLLFLALLVIFLFYCRGVLFPLVSAWLLYYLLKPLVNLLGKFIPKKIPGRIDLAIVLSFTIFIMALGLLIEYIIPPLVSEFTQLSAKLPQVITQLQSLLNSGPLQRINITLPPEIDKILFGWINNIFGYIATFLQGFINAILGVFSQFISFIIVPVITYYLLREDSDLAKGWLKLVPDELRDFIKTVLEKSNKMLQGYVESQLIICTGIGIICGLGLYLLGVPFFLVLGLIVAITELIPVIGPLFGAIPAVIVATFISPAVALEVVLLYTIVQSIGAYVVAPRIMGERLDLHPVTILFAVLILGNLIGVWGVFFAAPITAILKVVYLELKS